MLELGRLPIFGKQTRIPLEIDKFELSNHADHRSLCSFAKECSPKSLVIFHADDSAAEAIEETLASEMKVFRPSNYETMELSI